MPAVVGGHGNPQRAAAAGQAPVSVALQVAAVLAVDGSVSAGATQFPGIDFAVGPAAAGFNPSTAYSGSFTIGTNNTTITEKTLTGQELTIDADNVTIQGWSFVDCDIKVTSGVTVAPKIWDCSFTSSQHGAGQGLDRFVWCQAGVLDLRRCDMSHCESDPIKLGVCAGTLAAPGYRIEQNYVHDNNVPASSEHVDLIETFDACQGMWVINNTLIYPNDQTQTTACLTLFPSSATWCDQIRVENNLMGGCTYVWSQPGAGASSGHTTTNCTFTGNRISTQSGLYPDGGGAGVTYTGSYSMPWGSNGNVWDDNRWYDGPNVGQLINQGE